MVACHPDRAMRLAQVVISEIEGNRSLKIFKHFAESVCQACEAAAVHPQGKILAFDM
jgi:hypothetical protein